MRQISSRNSALGEERADGEDTGYCRWEEDWASENHSQQCAHVCVTHGFA